MHKFSYEELEKELVDLKKIKNSYSKERQHTALFDSMPEMVEVIELIYDKNHKVIDFYIRDLNLSFARFLGKTKEQLVNKKISSIVKTIEDSWFNHFARVDKNGMTHSFKDYGVEFNKYYFVTVWKVSKNRVGVSSIDITKTEKAEIELKKRQEKERVETDLLLKEEKMALNSAILKLDTTNAALTFQKEKKDERAEALAIAENAKAKRINELIITRKELVVEKQEKDDLANQLIIAKEELVFQKGIEGYRSEMGRLAQEATQLTENANIPIFGLDNKGLINEWNKTIEEITGYKKEEALGKNLVQTYITETYRKPIKKVLSDALKGKETKNYEFPLSSKKGKLINVLLNTSSRRDLKGKIKGVLGVVQDITELAGCCKELELKVYERTLKLNEALNKQRELTNLKSRFISVASHEFRTPLSAINFAAGSIKKYWSKMEPIMIEKKLHKIEDQVMHMTELLDDILTVGQTEASAIKSSPKNINLGDFMQKIIEEVYVSCQKKHEIVLTDPQKLKNGFIRIDEKLGRNIFINLIGNAIKFSPKAKKVCIDLSSEIEFLIITITDFGIGIPKSEFKNIFNPFTRAKNAAFIQGTGLGLSIVKEAIEVIGGQIIITSSIDEGSTFTVKIPKN
jgi:PAS domain S-box-containing protein